MSVNCVVSGDETIFFCLFFLFLSFDKLCCVVNSKKKKKKNQVLLLGIRDIILYIFFCKLLS